MPTGLDAEAAHLCQDRPYSTSKNVLKSAARSWVLLTLLLRCCSPIDVALMEHPTKVTLYHGQGCGGTRR